MGRAKKKRKAKRRNDMFSRSLIRKKMGKPVFFTLTHCSKKLGGISNKYNYKANMHNLCFADASFYNAKYQASIITDCNYRNADILGVDFFNCNMRGTSFKRAKLKNVVFYNCNLKGTDFSGATFDDVVFICTNMNDTKNLNLNTPGITVLIVVGAFIRIPILVVPFTLQFFFTMLAGLLLGGKLGFTSVATYIAMGLLGLPVFVEGGGLAYLLKPSFGYIIGFAVASYITGIIANKVAHPSCKRLIVANFIGLGIVYLFGMAYYYLISYFYLGTPIGLWPLFLYCFVLAVPGDIVLCILGAIIAKRVIPIMKKEVQQ